MKPQFSTIKFFLRLSGIVFVVACLGMSRAALAQSDVTPTPEVAPTDVPPPTDTPTDTATPLPPTDTPTATPIDTATPLPTDTPTTAPTDTPMPTDTPPPTDTPTATSTDTATPTDTPTDTATPLPTDTPTAMATPLPAALPFYDSFDAGTGWIASGSWTPDTGTAYTGSGWFADTTARNQTSTLESGSQIILNAASPLMTFWQQAHLSSADTVAAEISLDAGATWVTVDQQTALMANWQPHEVDLTAYAGQTIRLRFRVTTVGDAPTGEMSHGFWLDELTIQQPQPTATPTATTPATELPTATFTPTSTLSPTATPTSSPQVLTEPQSSLSLATASTVTVNFAPSDDAEVKSAYPSSNYGTNAALRTRNASGDIHFSYLKFNVAGISGAVQKAVLWVYVYDGSDDAGSVYLTSNAYRNSTTAWVQSGLNWSNAPALIGSPLSSAGSAASGVWISLDVTAVVKGNSVYSFVLTNNSTNSAYYNSKEAAANQPKLVVDFVIDSSSTNPTPTATPMATPTTAPTDAPMPSTSNQAPPDCSHYPEPRTFLESQAWWWLRNADQTGNDFGHIHLGTCFPLAQTVSGNVEFDLRIIMHHNPSTIHHVIVDIWDDAPDQCYGGGVACIDLSKQPLTCPMDQTCTWWVHLTAPTQIVPTDGRKEFRFRVFQEQPDGNRMFESTGWQAYVKNGKSTTSNYRSSDFVEARGWYTEAQYQNARIAAYPGNLKTLDGVVSGVWKPSVALRPGSGGQPTDHYIVMIDPDFHSHMPSEGIVVAQGPGQYVGTVSIDTRLLANGWHRLALRTDDDFVSITGECAQNKGSMCDSTVSGVLVIWFNVKN